MAMDDRGVSTALGYVLVLGIVALLSIGLIVSTTGYLEHQRATSSQSSIEVIGHVMAGDIATVDRLAATGDEPDTITLRSSHPRTVADQTYTIAIEDDEIRLWTHDDDSEVTIALQTNASVEPTTIAGGSIVITYDADEDRLVIDRG